jgi:hypothetical protein
MLSPDWSIVKAPISAALVTTNPFMAFPPRGADPTGSFQLPRSSQLARPQVKEIKRLRANRGTTVRPEIEHLQRVRSRLWALGC